MKSRNFHYKFILTILIFIDKYIYIYIYTCALVPPIVLMPNNYVVMNFTEKLLRQNELLAIPKRIEVIAIVLK